jgi:uncharacterized membrane protein YozB (DUF420 family)
MDIKDLPTLNALLNSCGAVFLILGYSHIKKSHIDKHKKWMLSAVVVSALFLTFYLFYHYHVGSVPYPYYNWTRPVYFAVLIPHIFLAAAMVPFILLVLFYALTQQFSKHKLFAKWVWPTWLFVSFSGVFIYIMLYIF